jgi:hypothetical protein
VLPGLIWPSPLPISFQWSCGHARCLNQVTASFWPAPTVSRHPTSRSEVHSLLDTKPPESPCALPLATASASSRWFAIGSTHAPLGTVERRLHLPENAMTPSRGPSRWTSPRQLPDISVVATSLLLIHVLLTIPSDSSGNLRSKPPPLVPLHCVRRHGAPSVVSIRPSFCPESLPYAAVLHSSSSLCHFAARSGRIQQPLPPAPSWSMAPLLLNSSGLPACVAGPMVVGPASFGPRQQRPFPFFLGIV